MNELLFFVSLIVTFGLVLVAFKFVGKFGLYVYMALSMIVANIEVCCAVNMFGFPDNWLTLGNTMFASCFLATDILNEHYGRKAGFTGVLLSISSLVVFLLIMQFDRLYIPASNSFMHDTLKTFFDVSGPFIWVTVSSVVCCLLANLLDVWLFDKIRRTTNGKHLWLRNNVATIISNCTENFVLMFLGYFLLPLIFNGASIVSFELAMGMALAASVVESLIALLDTPFIYLSKKLVPNDKMVTAEFCAEGRVTNE